MARSSLLRALLPLAIVAVAGCQDYNFNPVGHCLIQPGTERVTLSDVSTADVLFVVDDSGSMGGEQQKLAENFAAFIANLDQTNKSRRVAGLEPIDFHVAVTTTSVFHNAPTAATICRNDCPGATGSLVCCEASSTTGDAPMKTAKRCASTGECGGGLECRSDCAGLLGENICCDPSTKVAPLTEQVACATAGAECGSLYTHFQFDAICTPGNATDGGMYPQGAFVGLSTNPRVLHFDKELYPALDAAGQPVRDGALPPCSDGSKICNRQGYTAAELKSWFASQGASGWSGNVIAGTCGSGQEQGLEAAKRSVEKAVLGQQVDTRNDAGQTASSPARWLHDKSKLVLVFVGDEDDCSSPQDASAGVILTGAAGQDSCFGDATGAHKEFAVSGMVDYFASLGRPMGAAFIVSASSATDKSVCQDEACIPDKCCDYQCTGSSTCGSSVCGGQGPGIRLLEASNAFRSKGADVVDGSMCDPNFGTILDRIADIVKPPIGLHLPTQPAGSEIVLLRIATDAGATRKTCRGPAPAGMTIADAKAAGYDWWFTTTPDQTPSIVSQNIFINHDTRNCEANPGETYSADYLGRLPAGGCQTRQDCYATLGGKKTDAGPEIWTCYAGESPTGFVQPTSTAPGTCLCGDLGAGSY
jgi:hypothetical protein